MDAASVSPAEISGADLRAGARVTVSATVRNIGERAGDDVVFAYLADPVASIAQPVQRLRGFTRVSMDAGGTASVSFELGAEELGFWDDENHFVVEPGELLITVTDDTESRVLRVVVTP